MWVALHRKMKSGKSALSLQPSGETKEQIEYRIWSMEYGKTGNLAKAQLLYQANYRLIELRA